MDSPPSCSSEGLGMDWTSDEEDDSQNIAGLDELEEALLKEGSYIQENSNRSDKKLFIPIIDTTDIGPSSGNQGRSESAAKIPHTSSCWEIFDSTLQQGNPGKQQQDDPEKQDEIPNIIPSHESPKDIPTAHTHFETSQNDTPSPIIMVPENDQGGSISLEVDSTIIDSDAILNDGNSNSETMRRGRKRTRQPVPDPRMWAKEETKQKRLKGEAYVGYRRQDKKSQKKMIRDSPKEGRRMGPTCPPSSRCSKLVTRKCHELSHEARLNLFAKFWQKDNWGEKKMYVCSLVGADDPKQRTELPKKTSRNVSFTYTLKIGLETYPVCQTTFLNTFGLKNSMVRHWLSDYYSVAHKDTSQRLVATEENVGSPAEMGSMVNTEGTSDSRESKKSHLDNFLKDFPKLPSHYCRKETTREYLQTDITSKAKFYNIYVQKCREKARTPLSRFTFDRQLRKQKISLFAPKKDQCDTCTAFKHGNVSQESYDKHVLLKERAREEKASDKLRAQEKKVHVLCVDVMAVKLLPLIEASSAYFRMKLAIHNYSTYNLGNHDGYCCWFTETETSLTSSTFATILIREIERILEQQVLDVIIYSDGCTHQNRNCVLANALLSLSAKWKVTIHQKFLVKGHTQMEVDSVHSVLEQAIKNKDGIYLPHEFAQLTKEARKTPFPYRSEVVYHDYFKDYSSPLRYTSIRPGSKPNDPLVVDLRWIKFDPNGIIQYKLDFDEDFKNLPQRPKKPVCDLDNFPALNAKKTTIPRDKWDDLQKMKNLIPQECHSFFDQLPHEDISYRKTVGREKKTKK